MTERYLIAGAYRLDLRDERLWHGDMPVKLGGKALALLRTLMDRPQMLLTKAELFDLVWPELAVSDSVLTTAVKEARQALGDDARRPVLIETVHGRGYRFLLPVIRRDELGVPDQRLPLPPLQPADDVLPRPNAPGRRWIIVSLLLLVASATALWWWNGRSGGPHPTMATAHPKSIAVLPFEDLSPDGSQRWFAHGLTEEISNSLARTPDLGVASAASPGRFTAGSGDIRKVAGTLGVANILEGSVRRSGGHVRVTARLIRASDGFHLWSESYDRDEADMISIQEDIAVSIAAALKTVMDPARLRAMVGTGTRSVEAYEAYLRGLALDQRQFEEGDIALARAAADAYETARTLDRNFAAAHWKAAQTWYGRVTRVDSNLRDGLSDRERMSAFFERVGAAVAATDDEVERLKYQAAQAAMQLRVKTAQRLMASYLKARPRDIDAWEEIAEQSAWAGERHWIQIAAERVHSLSIESGDPRSRAITLSVMGGQPDLAVLRGREQLRLRPENALMRYQTHRALIWTGRAAEARALLPGIEASGMPDTNKQLARLRQACAEGRQHDARAIRAGIEKTGSLNARWQAAQISGDTQAATALLKPLDKPDRLTTLMQFMINPTFDVGRYPVLKAKLLANGVEPPAAIPMPGACK